LNELIKVAVACAAVEILSVLYDAGQGPRLQNWNEQN